MRGERVHHAHLNGAEAASAREYKSRFHGASMVGYRQGLVCSRYRRVDEQPREVRLRYSSREPDCATNGSALDERLFNDKVARLTVAAFEETVRFQGLAQLLQHGRTAAHHDPVTTDIQRRQADIAKQLS